MGWGRVRLVAVCGTLAALVFASPAAAQLPTLADGVKLPVEDGTVGQLLPGEAVEQVVQQPLPAPVEDVVENSPAAPVREEIRRVVGGDAQPPGGGGNGGNGGGQTGGNAGQGSGTAPADAGGSRTPAAPETQGRSPAQTPRRTPGQDDSRPGGDDRADAPAREDRSGRASRDGAAGPARSGREPGSRASDRRPADTATEESPLRRTIDRIVQVVPTYVWVALGVLLLISLALGLRAFVERRRARVLAAEREQLIREVGLLERALLPEVPEQLGAVAASVAYRPSEGPAAGGDFYDALELPGGRAAVLVGDVSGHGHEALERTNSTRTGLHACLEAGMSPRAALESVGWRARANSDGRFVTVVVAVHDPSTGTLTYATAGHPPPIVVGPCPHEPLTVVSSPPIGVAFRTGLRETTVPLPPGSVACFFTDGLIEARTAHGLLGRDKLTAMVAELDPDEQADALLGYVVALADEAPDDMAVCMLRPLSGPELRAPRTEILELEADDLDRGVAERFLDGCELPGDEAAVAIEQVHAAAASSGGAVLEVTIEDGVASAKVSAPKPLESVGA